MEDEESPTKIHEVERLIAEVKKYPILYDQEHMHYKNNAVRTKVWDKITESLGKDPQDRKKVMVKWKNVKKKFAELEMSNYSKPVGNTAKNQQAFTDVMQFIVPFKSSSKVEESGIQFEPLTSRSFEERETLHQLSEEIWIEDVFIDEIKKHPELFNPENKCQQTRKKIWAEIAKNFKETDKKIILKWKNLRRKYIMMRYPQSSRNAITGKRKIRYNQEFVDRLSFLDSFLNEAIVGKSFKEDLGVIQETDIKDEPIEEQIVFVEEASQIENNEELISNYDENEYQQQELVNYVDREQVEEDIIFQEDEPEEYEQIMYDDEENDYLYEEIEEPPQKKSKSNSPAITKNHLKDPPSHQPAASTSTVNPSYDAIDYFCLSLAEPLRRMDFLSQQRAKEKFYKVINEELAQSFSSISKV